MRAVLMLTSLLLAVAIARADGCPGLDTPGASIDTRRAALMECAKSAGTEPLAFLLAHVASLQPRDARLSGYGEFIESWPLDDLMVHAEQLLALAKGESDASVASRITAVRALMAIPKDRRPTGSEAFEPRTIELSAVPSRMTYDKKEIAATAGEVIRIHFDNADALEHNLLIVAPGALAEMGLAGDKMGQVPEGRIKEFIPDSAKVLAVMGIVAPGASRDFWFIVPGAAGTYPYVCTYPQHWRMMNGKLKVAARATAAPAKAATTAPPATPPSSATPP